MGFPLGSSVEDFGLEMGAVCSGGTTKQKREKGAVFKPVRSFHKTSRDASPASELIESDYRKSPPRFDSGEPRHLSFSRELKPSKPSTPTQRGSSKVLMSVRVLLDLFIYN